MLIHRYLTLLIDRIFLTMYWLILKIAICTDWFYPRLGGISNHVIELTRNLRLRGYDVVIITRKWTKSLPLQYAEIPIQRVNSMFPSSLIFLPPKIGGIEKILKKENIDIVHVHHAWSPFSISAINAAKKLHLPVILTTHTDMFSAETGYFWKPVSYALYPHRRVLRKVDKVIAVSNVAANLISNIVDRNRVEVIPNGVDTNRFRPTQAKDGNFNGFKILAQKKPIILFVGRHVFRKGTIFLPKVTKMLLKDFPNLQMLVCGKGYMQKPVQGLTQIHRLNGSLKMLGFVSDDDLPALYALSDIVVVPSLHSESFGIPLIEAMASGKPVIATKVSGIPEVVKNGVTGLLVEKRSSKEIAESLRFLLSNPEEYLKMSKAARELAVKEYSWDNIATRIENVYLEVNKTILTPNYV